MERSTAAAEETTSSEFVRWEEVHVSADPRRRDREEVRYYLERRDGTSDLAVRGIREKRTTSRHHGSYHYAVQESFLRSSISPSSPTYLLKLRSRREVIDWLNSIVSDSPPYPPSLDVTIPSDSKDACKVEVETMKEVHLKKLGHHTTEFLWLDSPWTCRKRRKHFPSFCRNGVKISVHDFVYVLAEEDKRLVAYLEDMYEDSRGNKMVVVRWFHKIDDVGIVLPQNYNDREIFFSLCLQDLSIECVDGLATVLSPQHYDKFLDEAKHAQLEPFVCHRQFDNDDIKSFDVTRIKDYWRQEILKYMYTASPSKGPMKSQPSECGLKAERNLGEGIGSRPKKKLRWSKDGDLALHSAKKFATKQGSLSPCLDIQYFDGSLDCSPKDSRYAACMPGKQAVMQNPPQHLAIGSKVEVLSQDSGLRGCWFRALIIKKHKDKVKVQYEDIKDGADEANNLEEWILASKVAVPDPLGLRMGGRTTVRPTPPSNSCKDSLFINSGAVVDVWWHDGWWEGIVLQRKTEDEICVYFPGEKQDLIFGSSDLRYSQEWLGNGWKNITGRPDLVTSILSHLDTKQILVKTCDIKPEKAAAVCGSRQLVSVTHNSSLPTKDETGARKSRVDSVLEKVKEVKTVSDLSKDAMLAQLRWKSSRKRRRGNPIQKLHLVGENRSRPEAAGTGTFDGFFLPKSLKVDHDNCKYIRDSHFSSSVGPPLTSLVMSR